MQQNNQGYYYPQQQQQNAAQPNAHVGIAMPGDYGAPTSASLSPYYAMPQQQQQQVLRRGSSDQLNLQAQKAALSASQSRRDSYQGNHSKSMLTDTPQHSSNPMATSADLYRMPYTPQRSPSQQGSMPPTPAQHGSYPAAPSYMSHQKQSQSYSGPSGLPMQQSPGIQPDFSMRRGGSFPNNSSTDLPFGADQPRQNTHRLSTLNPNQQTGSAPQSPLIQMSPSSTQHPFLSQSPSLNLGAGSPHISAVDHVRVNSYSPSNYNNPSPAAHSLPPPSTRPQAQRSPTQTMLPPSAYTPSASPRQPPQTALQAGFSDMVRSQSQSAYHGSMATSPSTRSIQPVQRQQPQKGFRRIRDASELRPVVNAQPAGRRADPIGGFISPVKALSTHLLQTYNMVNPAFRYEPSHNPRRVLTKPSVAMGNDGYDNEDADYILYVNDWLGQEEGNKYLILDVLGQGTFGQVVKCQNMKTHEIVAVKVVKNKPAYFNQSMMEVTILDLLNNTWDPEDRHHILRLKDQFIHARHLCLVFELLSSNLYELIKQNSFRGLSTSLVRVFTEQLLDSLTVLNEARLIHCDLKPENILLKTLQAPTIKVIDFGSACHEKQTVYTYIQSRFYRSPEVLLGLPYSSAIDMWSLGCICVELFLGLPLFPGTSEYNQISRIVEMLGMPPTYMLEVGKQANQFFEPCVDSYGGKRHQLKSIDQYSQEKQTREQPSKKYFSAATLPDIINTYTFRKDAKPHEVEREMNNRRAFVDFVQGLLNLNPIERWSPQQAKLHPFITGEPMTKPFVPPFGPKQKAGSTAPSTPQAQPSPESKRPYGGLPPAPQQQATRTYPDAASYNQHLNRQQSYTALNSANAQRQAQMPTNPYADPSPSSQQQQQYYQQQQQAQAQAQFSQQQQQQPLSSMQQLMNMQQFPGYAQSAAQQQPAVRANISKPPNASISNPPAVHHYPSRGRSLTIGQIDAVPPQLQKLGVDLSSIAGQSMTPVLRRDDQTEAWERRNDGSGVSRKVSMNRHHPALDLLTRQAEMGYSVGHPNQQQYHQQPAYQQMYPPAQGQLPFAQDTVMAPPPALTTSRPQNNAGPFDAFDNSDIGMLYTPLQASPRQPQNNYYGQQQMYGSPASQQRAFVGAYQNQQFPQQQQQQPQPDARMKRQQSRDALQWP